MRTSRKIGDASAMARRLGPFVPAFIVAFGLIMQTAGAACWKLGNRTGYIPDLESAPCTACVGNGCATYFHCPPGTQCKLTFFGGKPCTPGFATVPQWTYVGGACNGAGCCDAGTLLAVTSPLTCVVPADTVGSTICIFAEPVPE